jgi:hypothetical protein
MAGVECLEDVFVGGTDPCGDVVDRGGTAEVTLEL